MPIQATCAQCGASLPVPEEFAGQSVRCGGCRGVVKVPQLAKPTAPVAALAKAPVARPVAVPVARKAPAEPKPESPPLRTARKVRDEPDDEPLAERDDEPQRPKSRPLAQRRRDSIMTVAAGKWLVCFLVTGTVGLGILGYAAWSPRKNTGTALTPAPDGPPVLRR